MEGNTFFFSFEPALMEWVQAHIGIVGVFLAQCFTVLGEELILVGVLVFLYWCYDKKFGEFVGTNIVAGLVWNPLIKNIFLRRRPYFDHPNVKCLKPVHADRDLYDIAAQGYSFPSGHSTNSTVLYGSLPLYKKNKVLRVLAVVLPLIVGFSRIILGVHYPTDVLAGWLLGAVVLGFVSLLQLKVKKRWITHVIILVLSLPGVFYCRTEDYYTALGIMIGFFAGLHFEKRFVNFKNTRSIKYSIIRIALGLLLYVGLGSMFKFLFGMLPDFPARILRYAIVVFLLVGVYPKFFARMEAEKQ